MSDQDILECLKNDDVARLTTFDLNENSTIRLSVNQNLSITVGIHSAAAIYNSYKCYLYLMQNVYLNNWFDDVACEFHIRPIEFALICGSKEVATYIFARFKCCLINQSFDPQQLNIDTRNISDLSKIDVLIKARKSHGFDESQIYNENSYVKEFCTDLDFPYNKKGGGDSLYISIINFAPYVTDPLNQTKTPLMNSIIISSGGYSLFAKHWDINAKDSDGKTAFYYAGQFHNVEAGRLLLSMDIAPSLETRGLCDVICLGDPELVKIAFDKYGSKLREQFYSKVDNLTYPDECLMGLKNTSDAIEIIEILLDNGFDPDVTENQDCPTLFEVFIHTPFIRTDIVEYLIKKGLSLDTPFHKICYTPRNFLGRSYRPDILNLRKKYNI